MRASPSPPKDEQPGGPTLASPDVSTEELNAMLEELREEIEDGRGFVVVTLAGLEPTECSTVVASADLPTPEGLATKVFLANADQLLRRYDRAGVVPVVVSRAAPPFLGLKIAALPWALESGAWCLRCGRRSDPGHRCTGQGE